MQLEEISRSLVRGDPGAVEKLTRQALDEGFPPRVILEEGLIAGMSVVGMKFRNNEMYFPEVLVSARAMKAGMAPLEPILKACGIEPMGRCVLGTVKGDIHDIGKNLVGIMFKGTGFEVIDLGVNVTLDKFIAAIRTHRPDILGMSALLTTTMVQMKVNMEGFRSAGLLDGMKVMVGGAPVTLKFAEEIGAHAYGKDAAEAAGKAAELMKDLKTAF
ncbi:MAG: corrinoid protein [Acidobacteriia bacterium]|nr:corrinoid protein [Terriglobia bacterium]